MALYRDVSRKRRCFGWGGDGPTRVRRDLPTLDGHFVLYIACFMYASLTLIFAFPAPLCAHSPPPPPPPISPLLCGVCCFLFLYFF